MAICRFDIDNFAYNIESNMEAMGVPTPKNIFGSITTMSGALASIETALMTNAADMPIMTVAGKAAGTTIAGITAAGYAGIIIGSAFFINRRIIISVLANIRRVRIHSFPSYRFVCIYCRAPKTKEKSMTH